MNKKTVLKGRSSVLKKRKSRLAFAAGGVALGNKIFSCALIILACALFHIGNAGAVRAVKFMRVCVQNIVFNNIGGLWALTAVAGFVINNYSGLNIIAKNKV